MRSSLQRQILCPSIGKVSYLYTILSVLSIPQWEVAPESVLQLYAIPLYALDPVKQIRY